MNRYSKYHVCVKLQLLLRQCWHNLKVYHLCNASNIVEDLKNLIDHRIYTHIGFKFQNICDATNLLDLLTKQNYDDIETLLLILF